MKKCFFCFACLVLLTLPSRATTLSWGSNPGDELYLSSGQPLDDSFTFELGTFGLFIPTIGNLDLWSSNWRLFDRAIAPSENGWNSGAGFINSSATLSETFQSDSIYASPSSLFSQGEQLYIWAYNSLTLTTGPEWALVTNGDSDGNSADNWVVPEPVCCGGSTLDIRIEDATSVPLGGVNDTRGPGTFTADPPTYLLQTSAVPEPSGALLIGSAGLLALVRRRRRL